MNTPHRQLINLLRGWPSTTLLPNKLLARSSEAVFSNSTTAIPALCYGPDPGHEPLRKAIAQWLTDFYFPSVVRISAQNGTTEIPHATVAIDHERICITGGASQNLACILQVFTDPLYTRNIWCVSPVYFLAGRIFEDNGFGGRLRSVPEDSEGIDIKILENGLRSSEDTIHQETSDDQSRTLKPKRPWNKFYRHIIYAVPTFSNPSSKTMSLRRRKELIHLARKYDALVVTDDVYDQLQWYADTSNPLPAPASAVEPRLVDVDRVLDSGPSKFGNAVSNGSFSKIVGPGVRTGWAEATKAFTYGLSQCGSSRSGGAPSQAMAAVLTDIVESGELQTHISKVLQPAYAHRYACITRQIQNLLVPLGVSLPQTDRDIVGGYFIWAELPDNLNADRVTKRAKEEENLILGPGSFFIVSDDDNYDPRLDRCLRFCIAWEDEDLLEESIQRLAKLIKRMLDEGDTGNTGERVVVSSTGI